MAGCPRPNRRESSVGGQGAADAADVVDPAAVRQCCFRHHWSCNCLKKWLNSCNFLYFCTMLLFIVYLLPPPRPSCSCFLASGAASGCRSGFQSRSFPWWPQRQQPPPPSSGWSRRPGDPPPAAGWPKNLSSVVKGRKPLISCVHV